MSPLFGKKAARTTLYFASDIHGSEKCFRKFLNGAKVYEADVAVLGGDVAGKAIQAITEVRSGHFECVFRGARYEIESGPELAELEQLIADFGYYPYRAQPGELEAKVADDTMEALFVELMHERLVHWMELADERLRPLGIEAYWMLGNDDPDSLNRALDDAPWGTHCDGKVLTLESGHEFLSFGPSNVTPWNSYREVPEEEIAAALEKLATELHSPETAIYNIHVPPYGSGLDEAPALDANLTVQASGGQVKMTPVGSTAVREAIEKVQPLLGIHGHVHESSGSRMIGRTLCINPGSDYGTGILNGFIASLEPDRVRSHQFVRG